MIVIRNTKTSYFKRFSHFLHANNLSYPRAQSLLKPNTRRFIVPVRFIMVSEVSKEGKIPQPLDSYLLNKVTTQQEDFLKKYPTYDGRGIVIAILDTGVDPSLPGMQLTSDGKRKMIDVIDCSGAGDVDTSTVRSVKDGCIEGLSGRSLKIPENWNCPTGKYHVGIKPIYELYTKGLQTKISGEKKTDDFIPLQNMATADALKKLTEHEAEVGGSSDKTSDKWVREDYASKVDFLKSMQTESDVGPIADVITWHDGDMWRVCIDTSFRGRLGLCKVLGTFRETGDFGFLSDKDSMVYTVRVSIDGNLTEICVPCGAHGSHVAGIAAANYSNNPEKNGLAPGAQIVSLNIGDHRLGSMETGTAMTRAFNYCAELGVDVINMSYGEQTHYPDIGRVVEEARRLIDRKKVVYVSSAGNSGPALSTVGAPGGTTTNIIGVGAYLTAESADTLYGVFKPVESNIYPWSSRGPCIDGKLGVSICAPAAAFANVPQYFRQSMQMMNGTSMSSPNAAGNIACVLSGLSQIGLEWTPYVVKMAMENSAKPLVNSDRFSTGQGMIQIDSAFNHLTETLKENVLPDKLTHFEIKCSHWDKQSKGIYIREPRFDEPYEFAVTIEPTFLNYQQNDNVDAINFQRQFILQCDDKWVSHPGTFFCVTQPTNMAVTIDANKAPKGASFTEIVAIDAAHPHLGPVFRIPITVIVPEVIERNCYSTKITGRSGVPERRFVKCPEYATCAKITINSEDFESLDKYFLHTAYVDSDKAVRNSECNKFFMPTGKEFTATIPVNGGKTLEVCLVRQWSRGQDPVDANMKIDFFGVEKPNVIPIVHGSANTQFRIKAGPFSSFKIDPSISFKSVVVPLKPESAKVEPLGPRDVFLTSGMQINRALMTYKLNLSKPAEVFFEYAGISPYLYENPLDCLLFQVFNAGKAYLSCSSSYGSRNPHSLPKGEFTIQAQLRHPDESVLEKFKNTPLLVHTKLSSAISLNVGNDLRGVSFGEDMKWTNKGLLPGQELTLFAGKINEDKLPSNVNLTSGSYLLGNFSVFKDSELAKADKSQVIYYLAEYSSRPAKGLSMVTAKIDKAQNEEMKDAIRDLEVSWVSKLADEKAAKELFDTCKAKYPNHLPLLGGRIKKVMSKPLSDMSEENAEQAVTLAAEILKITNPEEVLQFFSIKQEHADDVLTIDKWIALKGLEESNRKDVQKLISSFDEKKNAIVLALQTLSSFEQDLKLRKSKENVPINIKYGGITPIMFGGKTNSIKKKGEELEKLKAKADSLDTKIEALLKEVDSKWTGNQFYVKLLVWAASDDSKVAPISIKHAAALGQFGRCAKLLNKLGGEAKSGSGDSQTIDATLADICDDLGWVHLSSHFRNVSLIKNRPSFRLF